MNKDTLYVKRKRPTDMLLLAAIYISATLAVALLLGLIVIQDSIPAILDKCKS